MPIPGEPCALKGASTVRRGGEETQFGCAPCPYLTNINPTYARERFREAHDLIVKAWTTEGPFAWEGKHYHFRYINLWPKPYQKPHPPIWIPGSGSPETMEWVAQQHYTYMVLPTLAPFELRRQSAAYFCECCEKTGYTARHEQIGWGIGIYVAETDEQARREYEPHVWYYTHNLLKTPAQFSLPPGHTSLSTMLGTAERRRQSRPSGLCELGRGGEGGVRRGRESGNRPSAVGRLCPARGLWHLGGEFLCGQRPFRAHTA